MKFVLTCCSTADMPLTFFAERQVPYVCYSYTMDGVERMDDMGKSLPIDEFYARIAAGAQPTTSQVNVSSFLEFFESYLREGQDVLHISLSSALSGSYNSACIARDELLPKYPERKLVIVDSLGASSGYGLLVTHAADLRDDDVSLEDTVAWVEEHKLNIHHWFFSTDLSSYLRGGRISKSAAVFGTLLNICPLLNMSNDGRLVPRHKYRGKKRVIEAMLDKMKEFVRDGQDYDGRCYISNSACYEDAKVVADRIEAAYPKLNGRVLINHVGTVIGSHTGPGTVALFFFGDKRVN